MLGSSAPGSRRGLAQDLEPVADAEHRSPAARELAHGVHDRREARDRPDAEVVAVGETAGKDHGVDAAQVAVAVPEDLGVAEAAAGEQGVDLVARAGEPHYAEPHAAAPSSTCTS